MNHLLRIHIGPVQEFIAAARRSRDLWFGSWLLSELSKAAARGIVEAEAAALDALIFPAPDDAAALQPGSPLNVANEIVAIIAGEPARVARAAHEALLSRLQGLIDTTFSVLRPLLEAGGTWEVAESQLGEFVEFYWVAVPLGDSYPAARALAGQLLAARKNTRNFAQVSQPRLWPKSSLDGARETVIPEADRKANDPDLLYQHYRARLGEQLSGVDLLKRLGQAGNESRFPSTSHVAAQPLANKLAQAPAAAAQAWQGYLATLPAAMKEQEQAYAGLSLPVLDEYDGSLLFPSRLLEWLEGAPLRRAESALRRFYRAADIEMEGVVPYYAILAGDGDFMGQAIDRLGDIAANQAFSRALAGFAIEARKIVRDHRGAVVFAGGDDVLALLPLTTAVACGAALAGAFAARMASYGSPAHPPSFSAGIAIVHHLEPLQDALDLARDAEKTAKSIPDGRKNALAVALNKRSGEPRRVAGRWGALDRRLLNLAALHQAEVIPDRLAYQILDSYHLLGGEAALREQGDVLREVLALEAQRIIDRKRESGGGAMVGEEPKAYISHAIADPGNTVAGLADELIIAAQMAKANKMTNSPYQFQEIKEVTVA